MSCPLASIVNPLKTSGDPQVMLFYLTSNQSVGLSLYEVREPKPDHDDPDDVVTITGIKTTLFRDNLPAPVDLKIVNPGSFSALKANHMINVYGFVQVAPPASGSKTIEPAAKKRIAQLSPVYRVLLPDEIEDADGVKTTHQVVGVGMTTLVDARNQGYMYCLTQVNGTGSFCIAEFAVGWPSSKRQADIVNTPMVQHPPLANTNLAAAFEASGDGGKKWIVYQTPQSLRIVESNGDNDAEIPNTDDARKGTGLAIVAVPSGEGKTKLYLYYFNNGGKIQRVVRGVAGKWGDSGAIKDKTVSDANSALTASKVGDWVVLHFSDANEKIKCTRDKIDV
ncbi:hypothetical protein V8F20_009867 [Naviculisporaceae sp. PSN 640]